MPRWIESLSYEKIAEPTAYSEKNDINNRVSGKRFSLIKFVALGALHYARSYV